MQNFGKIKNAFNELLAEGLSIKDKTSTDLFKKYIQTIKESKILKTQFFVISNIENKIETDREKATQFVKESIGLFSSFKKKDILESNSNLSSFITLCNPSLLNDTNYSHKKLHENISKLIFINKTPNTIDEIVNTTSEIVDYIINNKTKEVTEVIELPSSMLSTLMIDKYNEKYSGLGESDKKILKALINSTDDEKKDVYSSTIRECIDLIDEKLKVSDLDAKDKLLRVKDKLLNDKMDINEDFTKNISKLVELKDNLNNN